MKRILFILIAMATLSVNAQSNFGLTAGYLSATAKAESGGISISASESGFFAGFFADFEVSENFNVQPELQYISIQDGNALLLPVLAKYYVSEKFNLQAGPQLMFDLDESVDDFSSVNIDLAFGAGYDIDENFSVLARYSFQLNNTYTGPLDLTARVNFINVGLAYKF